MPEEKNYFDQVGQILRNRPTRPQLMKALASFAAEADRWYGEAEALARMCGEYKDLVLTMHAKSEEHIERMARILPFANASADDDKTPPDTVH